MKRLILLIAVLIQLSCSSDKLENYTIIISLDGFRADYRELYNTPNLDRIAENGVQAIMQPSFPSSTFPNHYTLATGLVPDHHGIVNNNFWDKELKRKYSMGDADTRLDPIFYGGEPIWVTAEKQGLTAATIYWVASDFHLHDMDPSYFKKYEQPLIPHDARADTVISWLNKPVESRPHFIMNYYEEPDSHGHKSGPRSKETGKCIEYLDSLMGVLYDSLMTLPIADNINLIITSDHGMATLSPDRIINPKDYLKAKWIDILIPGIPTSIFTKEGYQDSVYNALKDIKHLNVWKRNEIPSEVSYGTNKNRIGDIVVSPEVGWRFDAKPNLNLKGAHGYLPTDQQMKVMFIATGPDFKKGYVGKEFKNVDIYGMLCKLLKIVPVETDGIPERVEDFFKNKCPLHY